jgi:hypothetical protein
MKLEDQVCNPTMAKILRELNIHQEANFYWFINDDSEPEFLTKDALIELFSEGLVDLAVEDAGSPSYFEYRQDAAERAGNELFDLFLKENHADKDNPISAAFTVAELGVMLPEWINHGEWKRAGEHHTHRLSQWHNVPEQSFLPFMTKDSYMIVYRRDMGDPAGEIPDNCLQGSTEAEARAGMLIHLLENKIITAEEVNQRASTNGQKEREA